MREGDTEKLSAIPPPPEASPRVKMRMLQQMADALENEAVSLCRKAIAFEEEEFLLIRQVEDRQLEIARLEGKLEAQRSERRTLLERIERLKNEAAAMREEAFSNEDDLALSIIEDLPSPEPTSEERGGPVFFQRINLTNERVTG